MPHELLEGAWWTWRVHTNQHACDEQAARRIAEIGLHRETEHTYAIYCTAAPMYCLFRYHKLYATTASGDQHCGTVPLIDNVVQKKSGEQFWAQQFVQQLGAYQTFMQGISNSRDLSYACQYSPHKEAL